MVARPGYAPRFHDYQSCVLLIELTSHMETLDGLEPTYNCFADSSLTNSGTVLFMVEMTGFEPAKTTLQV